MAHMCSYGLSGLDVQQSCAVYHYALSFVLQQGNVLLLHYY